jgi:hypothetical protein
MSGPKPRLHLPFAKWPEIDRQMWNSAVENDDPFDDGPGARLAERTSHKYWMGWRRFLGFLTTTKPDLLEKKPFERVTREQVAPLCRTSQGNQHRPFGRDPDR